MPEELRPDQRMDRLRLGHRTGQTHQEAKGEIGILLQGVNPKGGFREIAHDSIPGADRPLQRI